ncbi:hypothetical protein D8Y22_06570 [Salinadaptatus halalkaliphilus]|uniref:DNA primase/polymerase bifunctional N-terminal domain-containing protein n=1 Tax=Salinadaptatus halalkaliphilus TaxID=2419781 RepID=A0A4S3TQM1_9EURY|nr:bifunctional DNA primase/polymerase [Salinadaptatus halalkaliphilus]THE65593.1 hypothetical protein D8Y22_06570 [Salinadaptatus halalkaliphilus]
MSQANTPSDDDAVSLKEIVAQRLDESGLPTDRFINVENGGKASTNHTQSEPAVVTGNYGVYAGRGLVEIDIDDYDESHDLGPINGLQDTLTIQSAHDAEHRYYHVPNAPEVIKDAFGVDNPQPEWGEVRVSNQYVVGPGSQLDGCDKDWCDECEKPEGGQYTILHDRPIAEISAHVLVGAIRATGYDKSPDESDEKRPQDGFNGPNEPVGLSDRELLEKAKNADDGGKFKRLWDGDTSGYPSHSEARNALVSKLAFWTGNDEQRTRKLFKQSPLAQQKPEESMRDFDDYLESKVFPVSDTYNPEGSTGETTNPEPDTDDSGLIELFRHASRQYHIDPSRVATRTENGESIPVGISSVVNTESVGDAIITLYVFSPG